MLPSEIADRYLQDSTFENYLALRREVVASPNYSPYTSLEAKALPLVQRNDYQAVVDALMALMPGSFLSPGTHLLLAYAHEQLGHTEEATVETALAQAAFHGLLQTGDGSPGRPYQVLQVSDEYDLLKFLGKKMSRQGLVRKDGRQFDKFDCEDGQALWFDLSWRFASPPPAGA